MKNILIRVFVILIGFQQICQSMEITYSDKKMTPGKANPLLAKDVICADGFRTEDWRKVSTKTKRKVFELYSIPWDQRKRYEVDHLIALTDGGSNDIENLWPQPYDPRPGAHEKDILEYWLNRQVCAEKMELKEAQGILTGNWHEKYLEMKRTKKKHK